MPNPQPQPHCTLDQDEGREHLRIIELSVPQMPWTSNCKSAVTRSGHKEIQGKSLGGTPNILLTLFNQKRSSQRTLPPICPGANCRRRAGTSCTTTTLLFSVTILSASAPPIRYPRKRSARLSIKRRQKRASRPNRAPNGRKKRAEARNGRKWRKRRRRIGSRSR